MKNTIDSNIETLVAAAFNCRVPEKTECTMKQVMQEFRNKLHSHPYITFMETCQAAQQQQTGRQEAVQRQVPRRGFWGWAGIAASVCVIAAASIYISTTYFGGDTSGSGGIVVLPAVSNDTIVVDTDVQPEAEQIEEEVVSNLFIVFKGTVVEHDSREPLSGVSVVCEGIEEITGEDGMFEIDIPLLTNQSGKLIVSHESYAPVITDINLAEWGDMPCVIPMYAPVSMEGYVRDEAGEIVTGVYVTVYRYGKMPVGEIVMAKVTSDEPTDQYGFYRITDLAAIGLYITGVSSPGKEYMIKSSTLGRLFAQPQNDYINNIEIVQKNIIYIRVTDADNNPVTKLWIWVEVPKHRGGSQSASVKPHEWYKVQTIYFKNGDFINVTKDPTNPSNIITNWTDEISIRANYETSNSAPTNVPMFGGKTLFYEIKLLPPKTCIAAGVLLDTRGNPLPDVSVRGVGNTDTNGRFKVNGYITSDPIELEFDYNFMRYTTNVMCGATNLIIRFPVLYNKIIGRVTVSEYEIIPENIKVNYLSEYNGISKSNEKYFRDNSGQFSFGAMDIGKNPEWKLEISAPDTIFAPIIVKVPYSDDEIINIGTVAISELAATIKGRVIDDSGKPVKASVILCYSTWSDSRYYNAKGATEATGEYAFKQLAAGKYKMIVKYDSNKSEIEPNLDEIKAGETKVVQDIIIPRE